ncbi:MAG: DUF3102 domain-containing protein [Methylobacterium sp.]|uniref:DUF3102 domain-containing protein n=1 Tax=Methylobacterium sp. TaxID=409 RepID=UPI0025851F7E|nr:DUF3102 domain-containing protein [Methylobacterium sp.]MBY0299839.1 DUF3102 domain-containing protein [Methylobacterium sp.]
MTRVDLFAPAEAASSGDFDYGSMEPVTAREARAIAERYRKRVKTYVIDTGRDLLVMKQQLDHGVFHRWIEAELGLSPRTAQNFMQAATAFADERETVSRLPPATIYALASPSTPEPIRREVVQRLKAGERVEPEAIKQQIATAKTEARRLAEEAKAAARWERMSPEERAAEGRSRSARANRKAAEEARRAREREEWAQQRAIEAEALDKAVHLLIELSGSHLPDLLALIKAAGMHGSELYCRAEALYLASVAAPLSGAEPAEVG